MSSQTPYKSILLYHGLGSGKTCSAIGISEEVRNYTKQTGINQRIFIVASPNVQDNFRLQLFDERKLLKNGTGWSLDTCVGARILNEINPTNSPMEKEKIISQAKTIINRDYRFMGYLQFANYIDHKINVPMSANVSLVEQELIKKHFSNSLVIIDEVHNITKESKSLSKQLKKLAKHADDLKFILLSATPMYNSPREIIWLTNLMNLNDGRSTIKYSEIFDKEGNVIETDEDRGSNLLMRKLNGYISYVRGENPYTFPFRVYPTPIIRDFKAMNSNETVQVPLQGKLYLTEISNIQKTVYDLIIRKSLSDGLFFTNETDPNFENMEKYGYSQLQAPLQSLIIVFPHKNFEDIIEDGDLNELIGMRGLENNLKFEKKEIKTGDEGKITIKCNYEYKAGVPRIFSEELLPQYSAKISNICSCIRESADKMIDGLQIHGGIIIVYTQYIYGGIVPMALALEEMGFVGVHTSLFRSGFIKNRIDARTMKQKSEVPFDEFKQAKYMILSGDKYFSQDNAEDIKIATSKSNMYGDDVRVILISRAASEGLDFKYIRQVHILDPWYNLNRTEQIVGRGVRNRSHCGLVFEERNVEIYLHSSTNGKEETADIYVYRYAETKAKKIGKITRLMKTVSVDCVLNHSQTNFTDEAMEEVARNGIVDIVPSTQHQMIPFKLGDKPFSEVCDYMEDCEYKCFPDDGKLKPKFYDELYDKEQISMNSKQIVEKIKTIFKRENVYSFDTIQKMDMFKNATREELYYALTLLIEGPDTIMDKYGRPGKLANLGVHYIFKPLSITTEQISLYESTVPVKTTNEHVRYEIETNDENIKTPQFGVAVVKTDAKYLELVDKMRVNLEMVIREEPNELREKNEDWYYNLNSIRCKMQALRTQNVRLPAPSVPLHALGKMEKTADKQLVCNTTDFIPVMVRLRILGFDTELLRELVMDHILETLPHDMRLILAKEVLKPGFVAKDDLERHIEGYFRFLLLDNKTVLVLAKDDENIYYKTADWSELNFGERNLLTDEMQSQMGIPNLADIVGFIGNFTSKDMASSMVFRIKNMKQLRNNKSAYLQNDTKIAIIKQLNGILKLAESPYSFDNETKNEPTRNTDDISKVAFAGIFEMLIRKYNREKLFGKMWFLRSEQAIFNNIKNL